MGINCYKENKLDEVTPCDDNQAVVTVADERERIEAMKRYTDCSIDIIQIGTNQIQPKLYKAEKICLKSMSRSFSLWFSL